MINTQRFLALLILSCIDLYSCGYTKGDADKYLPGRYVYEIPSGEIQELTINSDFTFRQILYSKKRDVLYENSGKMNVDGRKIDFTHWLECYEPLEPKMLSKPYITNSTGIVWRKPKGSEQVSVIVFDQDDYIFRKTGAENINK